MNEFFEPLTLGKLELPNRFVMGPMTRSRAQGGLPGGLAAEYPGALVLCPHPSADAFPATPATGAAALREGVADAVAMATLWLANPDLPARVRAGGPYNDADEDTFYGGDHRGYTDYATLGGPA